MAWNNSYLCFYLKLSLVLHFSALNCFLIYTFLLRPSFLSFIRSVGKLTSRCSCSMLIFILLFRYTNYTYLTSFVGIYRCITSQLFFLSLLLLLSLFLLLLSLLLLSIFLLFFLLLLLSLLLYHWYPCNYCHYFYYLCYLCCLLIINFSFSLHNLSTNLNNTIILLSLCLKCCNTFITQLQKVYH